MCQNLHQGINFSVVLLQAALFIYTPSLLQLQI
jgi:hypothetical protein